MSDPVTSADLKALAPALPPSERLSGSETADVLSALIAVVTHGKSIIDAAREGGNAVYDFYHQSAVDHASANDHPEPVRGQMPDAGVPPVPAGPVTALDYDKLAAAMVRAQRNADTSSYETTPAPAGAPAAADVTPTGDVSTPVGDTPAAAAHDAPTTVADQSAAESHAIVTDEHTGSNVTDEGILP